VLAPTAHKPSRFGGFAGSAEPVDFLGLPSQSAHNLGINRPVPTKHEARCKRQDSTARPRDCGGPSKNEDSRTILAMPLIFPNWNSLDSVRHAHSDLEATGLVFFALLVIAEAFAHNSEQAKRKHLFDSIGIWFFAIAVLSEIGGYWYGQRNDALSGQVIISLDAKALDAFNKASSALTKSGEANTKADDAETKSGKAVTASSSALTLARGARQEADSFEQDIKSAQKAATEATAKLADRTLTDGQVISIARELAVFRGQEYTVTAYWESKESLGIANRIAAGLQLARWSYSKEGEKGMMLGGVIGVLVFVHPSADDPTQRAASSLVSALNAEGIEASLRQENPQNPKSNTIILNVGSKR
jgi:hypothetical protein